MKLIIILSILTLSIWSCNSTDKTSDKIANLPIDTLNTLVSTNWNIVINETDSNLYYYNNQPFYFRDNYAYFFDQEIAEWTINGDTIFIRDTSYNYSINSYENNTMSITTYLIGKIEKITKDTLIIKKINGWGRPFYYNERYIFYNDTLIYNPNIKLNKIVYSTSTCFGECPAMAIEITSNNNYKFYGGENSEFNGYFMGSIDPKYIAKIEGELRIANIKGQPSYFPEPIDAPICEMIIYYNDSLKKMISGYYGDFPPRIKKIASLMFNSYKSAEMNVIDEEINFETKAHNPTPPPMPHPMFNQY